MSETQTKTFANRLINVAKGKDINNENFIDELENLGGGSIIGDLKKTVAQMDSLKKEQVAAQLKSELELEKTKMLADKSLANLSDTQFEVERQARIRGIIKKIILAAGGLGLASEIRKRTGLNP